LYLSKTNSELRRDARAQLKGRWGMAILAMIIYSVVSGIASGISAVIPDPMAKGLISFIISMAIAGPLTLGAVSFFIKLKRGEEANLENVFDGFKSFASSFILMILTVIFVWLWSLLLLIPGIIKSLSYSQAFYILNDNPEMKALDAITLSRKMMDGYKGKLFMMYLCFFGLGILSIFTLFIGLIWLIPYTETAKANFYDDVKNAYEGRLSEY
jgi:uncharacterized membrane protein